MVGFIVLVMHVNLNLIRNSQKIMTKSLPTFFERTLENGIFARILSLPVKSLQPQSGNLINEDDDDDQNVIVQVSARDDKAVTNQVIIAELIDRIMLISYSLFLVFFHS